MSQNIARFIRQHAVNTVIGLFISGMLLFFTLRVQAIGDERYVNKQQFQSWIEYHQSKGDEIMKRLDEQHDQVLQAIQDLKEEIKLLRQEAQRRPPPRFPQNQDDPQ